MTAFLEIITSILNILGLLRNHYSGGGDFNGGTDLAKTQTGDECPDLVKTQGGFHFWSKLQKCSFNAH